MAIGLALVAEAFVPFQGTGIPPHLAVRIPAALALGFLMGVVSSLLGVAGGELLIPTFVFVFGVEIKLAGTASLLVSFPTVAVGCWRYARQRAFADRKDLTALVLPAGCGSVLGAIAGAVLLPYAPSHALKLLLGLILLYSAVWIFRHAK